MTLEDAWTLVRAIPAYYHDEDEKDKGHYIMMNDVWAWACSDCIIVTDENVQKIAELYNNYGFCGVLYYQWFYIGDWEKSEFADINRFIEFVANEERICKEVPDYNKRGYAKKQYMIGELQPKRKKRFWLF